MNQWWTGIGFVAMVFLFVFISIPMMDRHHLAKRPGYQKIIDKTYALFPFRRS